MLLSFRAQFGSVPKFNSHGKQMRETDEHDYFAQSRASVSQALERIRQVDIAE
jgi:hypothetical protein